MNITKFLKTLPLLKNHIKKVVYPSKLTAKKYEAGKLKTHSFLHFEVVFLIFEHLN